MTLNFYKHEGNGVVLLKGKNVKQRAKNHIVFVKIFAYVVSLLWHVNHGKLYFVMNMDVEKSKLNHWIF
jgi:hypothetical protein